MAGRGDSCACSPMGKLKRSSLPYAPGGTAYWTTYTYDGLGRTLSVVQPSSSGTTTYLYEGNTVKVTSPSGKWKKYEMDAVGRMTQVTEPRPGSGTYTTTYSYNITEKLIGVSMPRDGVTQTRSFTYDTTTQSRLLSATNPENGTVSYVVVEREYNKDIAKRLPIDVQRQMAVVMSPTWNSSQVMTIGPKFRVDDPKSLIAFDFHKQLSLLAAVGPGNGRSSFIVGALAALTSYMSAPEPSSLQLSFLDSAASGFESEIANAIRLSLQ
ncbi:hypothetical protein [Bryobacter aggregatus]|uniref:hypothetical protein n=1 Tax=Bryobacter aggregatus TaxID=360054 RepID=UPI0012BAFB98|nr:hypothetical protein [Bryobacter aggregatus]